MVKLEKKTEFEVTNYARSKGWICWKLNPIRNKGIPDRLYIKDGTLLFIEFKAIGGMVSKIQRLIHNQLKRNNVKIYIVRTFERGKEIIDKHEK